ncbi:MAG: transcriptional regulator with XRE-family HTH domain [Candidatus Omnitrophota bacterium]|jgi:transcriptional regulator with XRE-family HTH domain
MPATKIRIQLAKELRRLRLKSGLTQEQVAEKIGLSLRYYQNIEAKLPTRGTTLETLEKLGKLHNKKLHNF